MAVLRFFAWLVLALGVGLLGADAVSSLESGTPIMRSTADVLTLFGIDGFGLSEIAPQGVAGVLSTVMGLPLWGILGPIGVVLTLVFRPID